MNCPKCGASIAVKTISEHLSEIGKVRSEKKAAAARRNGKKGGRPKKKAATWQEKLRRAMKALEPEDGYPR